MGIRKCVCIAKLCKGIVWDVGFTMKKIWEYMELRISL